MKKKEDLDYSALTRLVTKLEKEKEFRELMGWDEDTEMYRNLYGIIARSLITVEPMPGGALPIYTKEEDKDETE